MSGHVAFIWFVLVAYAIVASLGDAYYTFKGFSIGLVEANPVARWLQKKLGNALSAFVAISAFVWVAGLWLKFHPTGSFVFVATVAGVETFNTIRNYKLYTQRAAAIASQNAKIKK